MSNLYYSNIIDPKLIDAVNRVADGLEHIASAIEKQTERAYPDLSKELFELEWQGGKDADHD